MHDINRWHQRCLLQIDAPAQDHEGIIDTLSCFIESPEWLAYAVDTAIQLNIIPTGKYTYNYISREKALGMGFKSSSKESEQTTPNRNTIKKFSGDTYALLDKAPDIDFPSTEDLIIEVKDPLPHWAARFLSLPEIYSWFTPQAYIDFLNIGDLGFVFKERTNEEILDQLVTDGHLRSCNQENSQTMKATYLAIIKLMRKHSVNARIRAEKVYELSPSTKSPTYIYNRANEIRNALKRSKLGPHII